MDLLTGYDMRAATAPRNGFGTGGVGAAAIVERARCSQRPHRSVFWEQRARSGSAGGTGSGGTYQSGLFGEEVVADGLQRAGWKVLGHRVKTRVGELDLVARRGDTIVFAEVKTARPGRMGVEESIDGRQRHRIRRAAVAWMSSHQHEQRGVRRYRFDVFLVRRDGTGAITRIDHIRDAF
jgi:putative endonuclease